jgi:hypothetical protein
MALLKEFLHWSVIVVVSGALFLLLGDQGVCGVSYPLDKETVFCLYHKMSGEDMEEQDLEELCFALGRPTFTAYKPSEMFMKNALRRVKRRLAERMNSYSEDCVFKWSFKCTLTPNRSEINGNKIMLSNNEMPQPTPFIMSEMTRRGQRSLKRLLDSLAARSFNQKQGGISTITIYLKPEKTAYRFQERTIGLQKVFLPIRFILFHPVKMEITPP